MKWKTAITDIRDGKEIIRGRDVRDLARGQSFADAIFLLLRGVLPAKNESVMLNAMLVAAIDHGVGTASAMTTRIVASAKNSMHTAVAAGILALGDLHGGAIEGAAKFFQEHAGGDTDADALVKSYREHRLRIPGYGHAVLAEDERSRTLFVIAREEGLYGKHCAFAELVEQRLNAHASKPLPLNIDGAMAAILLDMGFDWRLARGVFIIARVPGLVAHAYEEMTGDAGLRRLAPDDIDFVG
ncbi:MAG: citryl-CoA lyase [Candidatus Paceibacterota bacterium]|jgi:citryl-CoA lyase